MPSRHRPPRNARDRRARYPDPQRRAIVPDPEATLDEGKDEMPFVSPSQAGVGTQQQVVRRIGDAILGGDFSGNARGPEAVDIQIARQHPYEVASGERAIVVGRNSEGSGAESVCFGSDAYAKGDGSVALGRVALVEAEGVASLAVGTQSGAKGAWSAAVGPNAIAYAANSLAMGVGARTYVPGTANIPMPLCAQDAGGDRPAADWSTYYCTSEVYILSDQIDLKLVTDETFSLPAGSIFFVHEVGLYLIYLTGLVSQPTVRFGITGTPAKHLAATACTLLTAVGKRERFLPAWGDGETSLSAGVTVAAVATVCKARWYWRGLLARAEVV